MSEARGLPHVMAAACIGAAWGGAVVGLAEATLIQVTSSPEDYGLWPFALLAYGAIGAVLGVAVALLAAVWGRGRQDAAARFFGLGFGAALLPMGVVVARYHIQQRVFHELMPVFTPVGIAIHAGLVLGMAVLAVIGYFGVKPFGRSARGLAVAIGIFAVAAAAGSALAKTKAGAETPPPIRVSNAAGHPNVILILADTLRADSALRRTREGSDGLKELARDGVVFDQAHAQSTWTRPSVATIVTSEYPHQHGAIEKMDILGDEATTLAESFADAGYWTAGFVTNINVAPIFNFDQGFGEYHYLAPAFYFGASDSATRLAAYKVLRVLREKMFRDRIYFANYYQDAEVVTEAVSAWLQEAPPAPFFLLIHFMDPHDPYFDMPYNGHGVARVNDPDPPHDQAGHMRELYEEDVDYLDRHLKTMFDQLRSRGLYEDSVIILASDHGEEFLEHGGWWHGATLYEEQLHVPLIVKRRGNAQGGTVNSLPARLLDVAPTAMASASLEPSLSFEGRDLWSDEPRGPVFSEEEIEGNRLASVRDGQWKLIRANPDNPRGLQEIELYNVQADPQEKNNRADSEPVERERLLQLLADFQGESAELE